MFNMQIKYNNLLETADYTRRGRQVRNKDLFNFCLRSSEYGHNSFNMCGIRKHQLK